MHASGSAVTTGGDTPLQSTSPVKDTGDIDVVLDASRQAGSGVHRQVQSTARGGDELSECSAGVALAPASGLHEHETSPEGDDSAEVSNQSCQQFRPSEPANSTTSEGGAACTSAPKTLAPGDAENEGKQIPTKSGEQSRAPEPTAELSLRSTGLVEPASEQGPSPATAAVDVVRNDSSDIPSSLSDTQNRARFDVPVPDGQKTPPTIAAASEAAERQRCAERSQDTAGVDTTQFNSIHGEEGSLPNAQVVHKGLSSM